MSFNFRKHPKWTGIFTRRGSERLYTKSIDIGRAVYGERLFDVGDVQYREWDAYRSKLAASIRNNVRKIHIDQRTRILYLGASSGTTVSHVSDICTQGIIYAVEFSPRSLRELVQNCVDRPNVIPILGDANRPFEYSKFISDKVDLVYMDVAQPNQTEIMIKNAQYFLRNDGNIIFAIKARSIDTTGSPKEIFAKQVEMLEANGFQIREKIDIAPYSEDHEVLFGRYVGSK